MLPDIYKGRRLAITLEPWAGIVLRDETGRDIATITINDKQPRRARLVMTVNDSINVRRENKENNDADET